MPRCTSVSPCLAFASGRSITTLGVYSSRPLHVEMPAREPTCTAVVSSPQRIPPPPPPPLPPRANPNGCELLQRWIHLDHVRAWRLRSVGMALCWSPPRSKGSVMSAFHPTLTPPPSHLGSFLVLHLAACSASGDCASPCRCTFVRGGGSRMQARWVVLRPTPLVWLNTRICSVQHHVLRP